MAAQDQTRTGMPEYWLLSHRLPDLPKEHSDINQSEFPSSTVFCSLICQRPIWLKYSGYTHFGQTSTE